MAEPATFLLDPPWPERGGGKIKRGADRHYDIITKRHNTLSVIHGCPHWPPAQGSHVYMWTTDNYLTWAVWLYDTMGAKIHRTIPWRKPRMGIGQYFRGCHELLLFGTVGSGVALRTDATCRTDELMDLNWIGDHSEKPSQVYDLVEKRSKGPYFELFARSRRKGWTSWGNEVPS